MDFDSILLARKLEGGGGGGSATLIDKNINANGTYNASTDNADGYKKVVVSVPNPSTGSLSITSNNTYDVTNYASAVVNVQPQAKAPLKDINFYDYDGTRLYSYTKSEWANVTALPANPSHSGLIAQGWNHTKNEIDSYVSTMIVPLDVGQTYRTVSGATEIDIELYKPYLSPSIKIAVNGTTVIDWGDGSTDTVTGSNSTTSSGIQTTPHTYASEGNYTIKLSITSGKLALFGNSSTNAQFLMGPGGSSMANMDKTYQSAVRHIRLGDGDLTVYGPTFAYMTNLETITIPASVAFASSNTFNSCRSLKAIVIPSGLNISSDSAFNGCSALSVISGTARGAQKQYQNCSAIRYLDDRKFGSSTVHEYVGCADSLQSVVFGSTITEVKANAFANSKSLHEVHILAGYIDENQQVVIPTLVNTNAFTGNASGRKIYVPRSTNQVILSAYQSASNWSTYASAMEEEPE